MLPMRQRLARCGVAGDVVLRAFAGLLMGWESGPYRAMMQCPLYQLTPTQAGTCAAAAAKRCPLSLSVEPSM